MTARGLVWWFIDLIFPWAEPLTLDEARRVEERTAAARNEHEQIVTGLDGDEAFLREQLATCSSLLKEENERRQGVDSRLTTVVGLSSIAGTIVLSVILTQQPTTPGGVTGLLLVITPLYLAIQIANAVCNAVLGLRRKNYLALLPADVLPTANEDRSTHLRRQIMNVIRILEDDRKLNNEKVTYMAVAHRAVLNFFGGLLILGAMGTWHAFTTSEKDPLIDRLRQDRQLQELLRGPQGPPGVAGPQGPPGPEIRTKDRNRPAKK